MADADRRRVSYTTAFATYDGRGHVLGASMLSGVESHLRSSWPAEANAPMFVKRAKFLHKTGCDGEMTVQRGSTAAEMPRDAACTVLGRYGEEGFVAWFMPNDDTPVTKNIPTKHSIEAIEPADVFAGSCQISSNSTDQFFLLVVDANKHVQLASQRLLGRKWVSELVSIENMVVQPNLAPIKTTLEIENLASRSAEDRIYTLNRLSFVDGSGEHRTLNMGFSFYPEQKQ